MAQPFSRTTRALAADLSTRWTRWIAAAILLIVPWLGWATLVPLPLYVTAPAIVTSAGGNYPVQSRVDGRLLSRFAELGALVQEGEVLFELDAETLWLDLEAVESEITALQAEIVALEAQVAAREGSLRAAAGQGQAARGRASAQRDEMESAARRAEDEAARAERLLSAGALGEAERAGLVAEAREARARALAARSALTEVGAGEDSRLATLRAERDAVAAQLAHRQGARDVARSKAARLEEEVEHRRIRAPVSGRLGAVSPANPGATLRAGELLATVVPVTPSSWVVRAELPPADAVGRVEPGEVGRMKLDVYPWIRFGTLPLVVRSVGSTVAPDAGRGPGVQVEAEVGETTILLQEGLTGTLEIEVERVTPAELLLRAVGGRSTAHEAR